MVSELLRKHKHDSNSNTTKIIIVLTLLLPIVIVVIMIIILVSELLRQQGQTALHPPGFGGREVKALRFEGLLALHWGLGFSA